MSILPKKPGAAGRERQRCRSCFLCPKYGGCGWDIAEYVMYCHLCGALSETCNTFMGYTAVRLRTAFVFYNEAQSSYYFNFIKISERRRVMNKKTNLRSKWMGIFFVVTLVALAMSTTVFGGEAEAEYVSNMYATAWSLVPPLVAIILALITKEVYSSLFIGIVVGGLFYANFDPKLAYLTIFTNDTDGGMLAKLSDSWNVGILIFLVILGIIVALMNKAGGSAAYGRWAASTFKTRRSAMLGTSLLGCLIFVDDYFNCLTVGSVMRPVTDTHKVSRAKLAYLIDATAAPICMIAPISSWAAAVSDFAEGTGLNGYELFIKAIPYNFYSLLTIGFVVMSLAMKVDFGSMKLHEANAEKGDLFTTGDRVEAVEDVPNAKGKLIDLALPIIVLIVACVWGLLYAGGMFDGGLTIQDAFANTDATVGLPLGAFVATVLIVIYLVARRVIGFKEAMECVPKGFISMVPFSPQITS